MPTEKGLSNLIINKVESKEVYNYMVANNLVNEDEMYLVQGDDEVQIIVDSALNTTSENPVQNKVVATAINNLNTLVGDTPVSDQINTAVASKADASDLTAHTGNSNIHITSTERTNWNAAKAHADSAHAPSNAEENQNAFSNIIVGGTTIAADSKTDTLTIVAGNNVTLTPDAKNDKLTITAKDTVYTHPTYTARGAGLYKVTVDGTGHVSEVTNVVKDDIVGLGIPAQDTTYNEATTSAAGLMSASDKTKLNGIADGANKTIVDSALSSTSTNPVQNKVVNTAISNLNTLVGNTSVASQISNAVANKVDKVDGKGLSTNDYTTDEKNKLSGIATGAEVNQNAFSNIVVGSTTIAADSKTDSLTIVAGNNITITPDAANDKLTIAATDTVYTHPTYTSKNSGLYKITVDGTGHVSAATAVSKSDITALGIPAQDTTYSTATQSDNGLMSSGDKTKLDGIETGANKTVVDSALSSTSTNPVQNKAVNTAISSLNTLVGDKSVASQITSAIDTLNLDSTYIAVTQKGAANGVAELDSSGKVPSTQLPSYVDDVLEYTAKSNFPSTGEAGKIYVDTSTNLTYRWGGSAYTEISPSIALGTTSSTAFRGDYGNTAYTHANAKGSAFTSGLYKITTNAQGHVTAATAVAKSDITDLGIPAQDTTYSAVTTSAAGLMSADDKVKLDGIATGATKITVDSTLSSTSTNPVQNKAVNTAISNLNTLVGNTSVATQISDAVDECVTGLSVSGTTITYTKGDGSTGTITTQDTNTTYSNMKGATSSSAGTAGLVPAPTAGAATRYLRSDGTWQVPPDTNTTYSAATTSVDGLMSAADKAKLDGIATEATKVTVDSALSTTSTNPVQNKVVNTAISALNTLVGDTPVATQITSAINDAGFLTADLNNAESGVAPFTNSDMLGGLPASSYLQVADFSIASATQLGGVMPVAKTDEMTQAVGVDANGRLYAPAAALPTDEQVGTAVSAYLTANGVKCNDVWVDLGTVTVAEGEEPKILGWDLAGTIKKFCIYGRMPGHGGSGDKQIFPRGGTATNTSAPFFNTVGTWGADNSVTYYYSVYAEKIKNGKRDRFAWWGVGQCSTFNNLGSTFLSPMDADAANPSNGLYIATYWIDTVFPVGATFRAWVVYE